MKALSRAPRVDASHLSPDALTWPPRASAAREESCPGTGMTATATPENLKGKPALAREEETTPLLPLVIPTRAIKSPREGRGPGPRYSGAVRRRRGDGGRRDT
jgi:hypothetical protein